MVKHQAKEREKKLLNILSCRKPYQGVQISCQAELTHNPNPNIRTKHIDNFASFHTTVLAKSLHRSEHSSNCICK